ncbi:MAG TPA: type I-U CRISPR-associated protein Csb2 [Solirubrobacterales bacterium]|nr:type I-U CRISPR-associated protein Csb2 [Solirubrobacterales bacterium]
MVCIQLRFPLGVYHALTDRARSGPAPEWAPSPVRLVGALLAAAHEVPSDDLERDRAVLQRLCEAGPPIVHAPLPVAVGEQPQHDLTESGNGEAAPAHVAVLRGASRWAPRNPSLAEMKGASPRRVGRSRTEVDKGGVATGDRPVAFAWPDLTLDEDELGRLRRMASDVAWVGTSRSPAIVTAGDRVDLGEHSASTPVWTPLPWDTVLAHAQLRTPSVDQIARFDRSFEARKARKDRVEPSGLLRPTVSRGLWPYAVGHPGASTARDPQHWGRMAFVALDRKASEMTPRAPSAYLIARAFRAALMDAFDERGEGNDAPPLLHGHGDVPHMAICPLPNVGNQSADGTIKGFALVFPHADRLPSVAGESQAIEGALVSFFPESEHRQRIEVPGAGSISIRPVSAHDRLLALSPTRYTHPSRTWATVTPVIHSRWAKGRDVEALAAQVAADCAHVDLPEPEQIEFLRAPAIIAGAQRLVPDAKALREEWRASIQGPRSHLQLVFGEEIAGPLLLGRARHFGVGLMLPQMDA